MHFVLVITEHRILGYVFAAYLIKGERNQEFYTTYDKLTLEKLETYKQILSPEQVQLVRNIENYNDKNLYKLFCRKKSSPHDFINNLDEDLFSEHIRPYVEKQIVKCLDLLQFNPEPVYHKMLHNKLYESDKTNIIDKDCSTVFDFEKNSGGIKYRLTIKHDNSEVVLTGKEGIFITNEPCCLALEDKLFIFRDIDSKKLIPFFDKEYIHIAPQTADKYLESFVKNAIAKYQVRAKGFNIVDITEKPKPVLSLEKNLQGGLSLVLKFIYKDISIYYANRKSGTKVTLNRERDKIEFTRIVRDYEFENECISQLLSFGLTNKEGPYFNPFLKKDSGSDNYGPVTWLNFNKKLLQKNGFSIAQKDLEKEYYISNFELKMDVSEQSNDWFDIMAIIEFDGFRIPFAEFKENIVNGIREYLLPNNKILILPEEWFESYSDLLNFSSQHGERLKLDKQHFAILNSSTLKADDKFRTSLKSLLSIDLSSKEQLPEGIQATLRNYQEDGYSWMYHLYKNRFGGCLADDMGLGKTLQTLVLLQKIKAETPLFQSRLNTKSETQLSLFDPQASVTDKASSRTSLIVVPTSLIHNWINEVNKFAPSIKIIPYVGPNRGDLSELGNEADIVLTSYGILRNDLEKFLKECFLYIILDESQMIKNPGSKTYAAVIQLKSDNRLVLSGTPIENSLSDLWAQFNFINPGLLGNLSFFQSEFQYAIEKNNDENKRTRLQQLIAPFILRRTKEQVAKELPELSEQIIFCDMNEVQEVYYEREKSKARKMVLENINRMGYHNATMQILKSLMRLRQIANHPVLSDSNYISGSGKFNEVTRNLDSLYQEGHKALIFSSFVGHLDLVADWLESQNYGYTKLTGETRNREKVVEEFQTNKSCNFFLISLKAGGVGLNLTAASYVLMLDPWWNPASEKQAINRAHRIGQDKHVMVYRFITQNTLEEKIIKLQERKSELADIFVNENSFKNISREEIMELFE